MVGSGEKRHKGMNWPAFVIVGLTTAALIYGTLDMPRFGDPKAPVQRHVAPEYISQTVEKSEEEPNRGHEGEEASAGKNEARQSNYFNGHVPNLVTSVIVNYRAYDTLFEVADIFTAGISLILLLRLGKF